MFVGVKLYLDGTAVDLDIWLRDRRRPSNPSRRGWLKTLAADSLRGVNIAFALLANAGPCLTVAPTDAVAIILACPGTGLVECGFILRFVVKFHGVQVRM